MKAKTIGISTIMVIALIGILVIVPVYFPAIGAQAADIARSVVGPEPVGAVEGVSADAQDIINKTIAKSPEISVIPDTNVPKPTPESQVPIKNVVTADPQIGWQEYGPLVNGEPVMAQALLTPDPDRPYAAIVLVRIDLSKVDLHMVPGSVDPSHSEAVVKAFPNFGKIPTDDLSNTLAAFNGGFKATNGGYGMMIDGFVIAPPKSGIATIVQFMDGTIEILNWGENPVYKPIESYRQNCPPILENGQIPDKVNVSDPRIWGYTLNNSVVTWRSGLGITEDGRYLIYAVGNATTVPTLATTLKDAGAYNAMQLDINKFYVHFVTYQMVNGHYVAVQLLRQMSNEQNMFISRWTREFFYLTAK